MKEVSKLAVVRNFREVIEKGDISHMNKELYEFVTLNCQFIAHYNIEGFKGAYKTPKSFVWTFIRHFDKNHPYFCGAYDCDNALYKNSGFRKAEIKHEFIKIVDKHKLRLGEWVLSIEKKARFVLYQQLKAEFGK